MVTKRGQQAAVRGSVSVALILQFLPRASRDKRGNGTLVRPSLRKDMKVWQLDQALASAHAMPLRYTPPKGSAMFPCEEANDQSCREGAEPRRAGSARDAGAWGGRLPAGRHLYGKSSLQDGWIRPWGFTREDHAARHRLGVRPVRHSEHEARG